MIRKGKYIYGILPGQIKDKVDEFKIAGIELISYNDVSAVVKESDIIDYDNISKEKTARVLLDHQQVIEKVMSLGYNIIPMKLGTVAVNETYINRFLKNGFSFIKEIGQKTDDTIEIDIVATWGDFQSTLKEISEEKKIKEFKQKLIANPSGITIQDQQKIGVMIAKAIDQKRIEYAKIVHNKLSSVSIQTKKHDVMNEQMLLNTAFLVDKNKIDIFDNKVDEVNDEFQDKLNFRYIGPLPCYSFYTFEIEHIDFDDIDSARMKLGLKGSADIKEIKKAYKTAAMKTHPDKHLKKTDMDDEFNTLHSAYEKLTAYCMNSADNNGHCFFEEKEVNNNNILIKLKDFKYE